MSHGEGWQFIQMGRYIERAAATTTAAGRVSSREILRRRIVAAAGYEFLEGAGLLRCCSAFEAYCNAYTADFTPERITEFLLLNPDFPHSVRYSVDCLRSALMAIGARSGLHVADELVRVSGRLQASLSFVDIARRAYRRMWARTCRAFCSSAGRCTSGSSGCISSTRSKRRWR